MLNEMANQLCKKYIMLYNTQWWMSLWGTRGMCPPPPKKKLHHAHCAPHQIFTLKYAMKNTRCNYNIVGYLPHSFYMYLHIQ